MSDILKNICDDRLAFLEQEKAKIGFSEIRKLAEAINRSHKVFASAIKLKNRYNKPALIAEVKKASPSRGIIRADFNPVEIALSYENAGAACISVLTEEKYFSGSDEYLKEIRQHVSLPILRKDFILDEYQIYQSKILGADCILLIVAALDLDKMKYLEQVAIANNLDVLVEVHDEYELEDALQLETELIGVNNRNLKTLEITLDTSRRLATQIPKDKISVCESGIYKNSEIKEMMKFGYSAFLVGESLMRNDNIEQATKELLDI
ncbi:MAG TPA: indole-3-glycerol phosphate synthase TrpC [Alphaproteobacteria bacterium]|nr:indole-3-glycerol phosphate synthase TrpC [Alphaproteobacteria bacterium]